MTMNIFERAARAKLRFATTRGQLSTEQLFDLTLAELNSVAKEVNRQLKSEGEESFLEEDTNPNQVVLTLRLDILKHIIATKQIARKAAETRAVRMTRKRQLEDALEARKVKALDEMSEDDLLAALEDLST